MGCVCWDEPGLVRSSQLTFSDSNKTISDVLTEFEEGGCLSQYDKNGVSHSRLFMSSLYFLHYPELPTVKN